MPKINVFISYAREDIDNAKAIRSLLASNSFEVWMDVFDILPGEKWNDKILDGLHSADFILLCLSTHSVTKRGYLQKELKKALELAEQMLDSDIYLLPVRIDACELPGNISTYQCVDLFSAEGETRLLSALREGAKRRGLNSTDAQAPVEASKQYASSDLSKLGTNKFLDYFAKKRGNNE